jgi:hypothetical protein
VSTTPAPRLTHMPIAALVVAPTVLVGPAVRARRRSYDDHLSRRATLDAWLHDVASPPPALVSRERMAGLPGYCSAPQLSAPASGRQPWHMDRDTAPRRTATRRTP